MDNYYKEALTWSHDSYYANKLWLRRATLGIVILSIMLFMSLLSHLLLLPLKEKVPFLYAFDNTTGEITKLGELESSKLSANWELTRYLLIHYVINYESYNFDNLNIPYQLVWAQSSLDVRTKYEALMKTNNKNSNYHKYGKDKYITVHVLSVNRLNENTVDIRFAKTLHDKTTNSKKVLQKEAIVKWEFQKAQTSQKMLDRDPLGFKVTYYQVSQVNLENNEDK